MTDFDSFGSNTEPKGDKELQEFLLVEKQKAQFNAQVGISLIRRLYNVYLIIDFFVDS